MPFGDGDNIKYFVVRGICEGDRRVTRCDMVRVMDWDQLVEYSWISRGCLGGDVGHHAIQAEGRRGEHAV